MALIQKIDNTFRDIHDFLRSGVNLIVKMNERIELPTIETFVELLLSDDTPLETEYKSACRHIATPKEEQSHMD
jgi:hypothetical protein